MKVSDKKSDNPNAFPLEEHDYNNNIYQVHQGMSLRDYFAAKAMQAFISTDKSIYASENPNFKENITSVISRQSYLIADKMLKEREL